ncbi:MAG: D-2-hydroxyacid dehydrogenase [Oscillospiraceae bacterium]|jgi:glycerate dehydrogenase|nr:D-2-hydroxyacid dehydrogenase [Oscillospiraceae bacterium]
MNIVILDGFAANPGDLRWDEIAALGELAVYDRTPPDLLIERAERAQLLLTNKTVLSRDIIEQLPELRYIGLLSTGCNVVDLAAARARGVPVTNIPAYSTASVAQMTFALLLELAMHARAHSDSVRAGGWASSRDFCYTVAPLTELEGKTLGIVGFGQIGRAVAAIAQSFGMRALVCRRPANGAEITHSPTLRETSFDEVLRGSDMISLHCPLTDETQGLINSETIAKMRPGAWLINTSRGPVLNEGDVAAALREGRLGGCGLDVLSTEPPRADNPLLTAPNCIITPHIAWATKEARARLLQIAAENLRAFLRGAPQNVVND